MCHKNVRTLRYEKVKHQYTSRNITDAKTEKEIAAKHKLAFPAALAKYVSMLISAHQATFTTM